MISIITPWSGETHDLIGDYVAAVQHISAEIITIDNASVPATASALQQMTAHLCGQYIRNDSNIGFSAANNQGYSRAAGDVIVFMNSDIAADPRWLRAVLADVRDGALYGPSLQQQLVAGRWLPYIEGWCIAATRATWDILMAHAHRGRLHSKEQHVGPWDNLSYPGPYWEDNDLCLRALQCGVALIQTAWPIQHKGGRTAGGLSRHAESFERNRATFAEHAAQAFLRARPAPETAMQHRYRLAAQQPSDIQHHLPLLYSLARGNVLELGTRTGVSTAALLAGVEAHGGHVWSVDIDDCAALYAGHPQWTFVQGDSRDAHDVLLSLPETVEDFNLLLIDTIHTYEHVADELSAWAKYVRPGGAICIHDPETFPGVRRAVIEFCQARGWPVTFVLPCNGMAVVGVPR